MLHILKPWELSRDIPIPLLVVLWLWTSWTNSCQSSSTHSNTQNTYTTMHINTQTCTTENHTQHYTTGAKEYMNIQQPMQLGPEPGVFERQHFLLYYDYKYQVWPICFAQSLSFTIIWDRCSWLLLVIYVFPSFKYVWDVLRF